MTEQLLARIAQLEADNHLLLQENQSLRQQLNLTSNFRNKQPKQISIKLDENVTSENISAEFSIEEKISIFRQLFRGREDVYSLRWESKNGRSGYSPACENEWLSGVCEKPRIKCGDCNNRKLLSISNDDIYHHLAGKKTIGAYALLSDETCWFLAADFDGKHWKEDALAFAKQPESTALMLQQKFQDQAMAHMFGFF